MRKEDPVVSNEDAAAFKKLGYTSEQIKKIKDELNKAGFVQPSK